MKYVNYEITVVRDGLRAVSVNKLSNDFQKLITKQTINYFNAKTAAPVLDLEKTIRILRRVKYDGFDPVEFNDVFAF